MSQTHIHPSAIIHPKAEIADGVTIGPYCVIGHSVKIGSGTVLASHVVIDPYTTVGSDCDIAPFAVLGGKPQDHSYKDERSFVEIGDRVLIREAATINRATGEDKVTRVGDGSMIMAYSHLAHNVVVGKEVTIANNVQLAGYVEIGDYSFISGSNVFHQFVRMGRYSIMGGFSGTRQDIPPFSMTDGRLATVVGINKVGLRRRGFSQEERHRIRKAFQMLWLTKSNFPEALASVEEEMGFDPHIQELLAFIKTSKRGIRRPIIEASQLEEPGLELDAAEDMLEDEDMRRGRESALREVDHLEAYHGAS
ncbi:MAG: acyl-ACP--UDP-N-acetylglucosamine O-acyltransferase [Cyanobacteria bacterium]|nr:acyl-ACP--UDP-N-acetylglucosamine O-acyltransferase [Cyanobacteriota bacterium]